MVNPRLRHGPRCRGLGKVLCAGVGLIIAAPLAAHHANSAYDRTTTVTVSGTVTRWQFINPHAGLWLDVTSDDGSVQEWSGEFQGTLDLYRHFTFNKDTFKPGDEITLVGHPARNGAPTMAAVIVKFPDGKEVNVRNAPD